MIKQPSGYQSFDFLNQKAATVAQPTQTKFGSALTSISDLLKTTTNTVVTLDGVFNKDGKKSGSVQPTVLYPSQDAPAPSGSGDMIKYAALTGIAVGGGIILLKVFKK